MSTPFSPELAWQLKVSCELKRFSETVQQLWNQIARTSSKQAACSAEATLAGHLERLNLLISTTSNSTGKCSVQRCAQNFPDFQEVVDFLWGCPRELQARVPVPSDAVRKWLFTEYLRHLADIQTVLAMTAPVDTAAAHRELAELYAEAVSTDTRLFERRSPTVADHKLYVLPFVTNGVGLAA